MAHTKGVDKSLLLSTIEDLYREGRRSVRLHGCRIDGEPTVTFGLDANGQYEVTFLTSMDLGTSGGLHHATRDSLEEIQLALAGWLSAASQENSLSKRTHRRFGSTLEGKTPLAGRLRRLLFS